MIEAEQRADALRAEISLLTATSEAIFELPPLAWVERRVRELHELLGRDTTRSALLLRRVLGPVCLVPISPEVGRPYYQAETTIQLLDLLQEPDDGSNSLRKWTRSQPIRTAAELPLRFSLLETRPQFAYQRIAIEAERLRKLGLCDLRIAGVLGVTDKTVTKARQWLASKGRSGT